MGTRNMVFEYNQQPSFIERMQNDMAKRAETGQVNELKREAKAAPPREARRIHKMVNDYEKQKKKGQGREEEVPKPQEPKVVKHDRNKIREKNRYLDQWGPLGW